MTRERAPENITSAVPEEGTLLCEGCGYILRGLPDGSCCPECAKPIAESLPGLRHATRWELARPGYGRWLGFWRTTAAVLFRPARFYRTLATRGAAETSGTFAGIHISLASTILGLTAMIHMRSVLLFGAYPWDNLIVGGLTMLGVTFAAFCALALTIALVARLTAWEAAYRGLRLPRLVAMRALHYHAAHYLPVSIVALMTVAVYRAMENMAGWLHSFFEYYLYALCAEVVLAAIYLFKTYWIGMRNIMYANR